MTEQEIRSNLEKLDLDKLFEYCDALDLERPTTKEETINLLVAKCPSCMIDKLHRNAKFVVKYLNLNVVSPTVSSNRNVVKSKQPCKSCP